tara:strand:+ start:208 stop:534 length:327 start_codon:yes stop_codon:yes gene_type:complete
MDHNNTPPEEQDEIMSKIEQMQMDQILLDKAYNNAWLVLSGQITFDELLGTSFKRHQEESMIMAYDPDKGPKKEELENMIAHWIEAEEYERCSKLTEILNKTYPQHRE